MTRKKVKLAWIMSDSARKASLKKRRLGLIKKVSELSILCGVNACLIMYSPDEVQPVVWPSPEVARDMVRRFRNLPEMDQLKKMTNQETYLKDRFTKSHEQVTKCHKKNKEVETGFLMQQIDLGRSLDDLSFVEKRALLWMLDEKIKIVRKRMEFNQLAPYAPGSAPSGQFPPTPEGQSEGDESTGLGGGPDPLPWDEWFMEMVNNEPKYAAGSSSTRSDHMGFPYDHNPFAAGSAPDDHLGLPRYPYGGSSSASADMGMGLQLPAAAAANFRVPATNMQGMMLPQPTNMQGMLPLGGASEMGWLPRAGSSISAGGSNYGFFGSDAESGGSNPYPLGGYIGTSSSAPGADQYGQIPPFGFIYRGSTDHVGNANDYALPPFDGKNWPNNFAP